MLIRMLRLTMTLVALLGLASVASAQDGGFKELKTVQNRLTDEQLDYLRKLWTDNDEPMLLVTVGVVSARGGDDTLDFSTSNPGVNNLEAALRGQLARAMPGGVIDLRTARANNDRAIDRMQRKLGGAIDPAVEKELRERFKADIRLEVILRRRGSDVFTESWSAIDLTSGTVIANGVLNSNGKPSDTRVANVFSAFILNRFLPDYENWILNRRLSFTITLYADGGLGRDAREMLEIVGEEIEDRDGVTNFDVFSLTDDGVLISEYTFRYAERFSRLRRAIRDVLEDEGFDWGIESLENNQIAALIYKSETPDWYTITHRDAEDHERELSKVKGSIKGMTRAPEVAIVLGQHIADPGALFDRGGAEGVAWNDQRLESAIKAELNAMGLRVKSDTALKDQFDKLARNAERYRNVPHMLEAMDDLTRYDYLLHVNTAEGGASQGLIASLIDLETSDEVASPIWSPSTSSKFSDYEVSGNDVRQLAKYLVGNTMLQWSRYIGNERRTTLMQVRNFDSQRDVIRLQKLLSDSVRGFGEIGDLQINTGIASFEIYHEGNTDELVVRTVNRVGEANPGAEVQVINGAVVVNMAPASLDEATVAALRERRIALAPDEPDPDPAPASVPPAIKSEQDRLVKALRGARDSVWLIRTPALREGYVNHGTAWTVADGWLATNAHCVDEYILQQKRGENVTGVAFSDSGMTRTIKLGRAYMHPRWSRDTDNPDFFFDVALIEVIEGDPGPPLKIASEEQLEALVAPVIAGYVGFPADGVWQNDRALHNKQAFIGQINAIVRTDLVDSSGEDKDKMVMHNITGSKGASGSPILDATGHVVALHNSGQIRGVASGQSATGTDRIVVQSGFKGGVRVDILMRYMEELGIDFD